MEAYSKFGAVKLLEAGGGGNAGTNLIANEGFENITARKFENNDNGFSAVVDVFKFGPDNLQQPNESILFTNCTIGQPATNGVNAFLAYRLVGVPEVQVERVDADNIILSLGFRIREEARFHCSKESRRDDISVAVGFIPRKKGQLNIENPEGTAHLRHASVAVPSLRDSALV